MVDFVEIELALTGSGVGEVAERASCIGFAEARNGSYVVGS